MTNIEKFESKIYYAIDGCWYWIGNTMKDGYGAFYTPENPMMKAHRFSYQLYKGSADGLFVCHSCDNPLCVNPDHLFLGTLQDNLLDMRKKGRGPRPLNAFSNLRGVSKVKNRFRATVYHDKKVIHLGYYDSPDQAAMIRDKKVLELGIPVPLNFTNLL